jgi:hypothetical protein
MHIKSFCEQTLMWRTALSMLLIGSTLFGQSVCCCTLRAVNFCTTNEGQPAEASCCCSESSTSDKECPLRSNHSGHKCPCKNGNSVSAKLGDDQIVLPVQFADWSRLVAPCPHFMRQSPIVVTRTATQFGSSAFPHLDRVGILRAVNSLRC